jgi:hypothetical protein
MTDTPRAGGRSHRTWVEVSAALCAVAVSAASLFISLRQNTLMERQLSASVWPSLQLSSANYDDKGNPEVSFTIRNVGVGPARIRSFVLEYDEHPVGNARQLIEACCVENKKLPPAVVNTQDVSHLVLTANEKEVFLRLDSKDAPENPLYWKRLNHERDKVSVRACFCSELNECWMFDSAQIDQKPVAACPATTEGQFQR